MCKKTFTHTWIVHSYINTCTYRYIHATKILLLPPSTRRLTRLSHPPDFRTHPHRKQHVSLMLAKDQTAREQISPAHETSLLHKNYREACTGSQRPTEAAPARTDEWWGIGKGSHTKNTLEPVSLLCLDLLNI